MSESVNEFYTRIMPELSSAQILTFRSNFAQIISLFIISIIIISIIIFFFFFWGGGGGGRPSLFPVSYGIISHDGCILISFPIIIPNNRKIDNHTIFISSTACSSPPRTSSSDSRKSVKEGGTMKQGETTVLSGHRTLVLT